MRDLLEVKDLHISVPVSGSSGDIRLVTLVDRVSFVLKKGKVLGLIGESGAGKSTIGLSVMAYGRNGVKVTGGNIMLDGGDVSALDPQALRLLRGRRITYVAQSAAAAFNPYMRLEDQVIEASVDHGLSSRAEAKARATELFGLLGLPNPKTFGRKFPHQASGGQLQRAMTAMALCPKPDIVVFDEPTTALDVSTQLEVLSAIKTAIATTGAAALYISHDLPVVAQVADDIMVLRHGKTVEYGPTWDVLQAPKEDYTRALVFVSEIARPTRIGASIPIFEGRDVTAGYHNLPVLEKVNFKLCKGQTLAIVGESGSGKSTLARAAVGLMPNLAGQLVFDGRDLSRSRAKRSREDLRRIQLIYQIPDTALNPRCKVRDILGRPLELYFGMKGKSKESRLAELMQLTELPIALLDRYPAALSGGQKQRVAIARAIAAQPDVIFCDEPTSALDPLVAKGILQLLGRLQAELGVSYVFITHDIGIVRAIADTVIVMHKGRVVREGPRDIVLAPPYDDYTQSLLSSVPEMQPGWLDDALARSKMLKRAPEVGAS